MAKSNDVVQTTCCAQSIRYSKPGEAGAKKDFVMKAYEYLANAMKEGTTEIALIKIKCQLREQCKDEAAFQSAYNKITRKALALHQQQNPALMGAMPDPVYDQERKRLKKRLDEIQAKLKTPPVTEPIEPEYEIVETVNGVPNTWANALGMFVVVFIIMVVAAFFYEPDKDNGYTDYSYKPKVTIDKGYVVRKKR